MATQLDVSKLDLQDALDFAVMIEKESEERYLMFEDHLGHEYKGDAADFFIQMARSEGRHATQLEQRRLALFGDAPSRIDPNLIIGDIEAPDMGKPRPYMSPRHALEVAMESEVKAYEFYTQAIEIVENEEVRTLFRELREEEAEHQRLLNAQKSKFPDTLEPDVDSEDVDTPAL